MQQARVLIDINAQGDPRGVINVLLIIVGFVIVGAVVLAVVARVLGALFEWFAERAEIVALVLGAASLALCAGAYFAREWWAFWVAVIAALVAILLVWAAA